MPSRRFILLCAVLGGLIVGWLGWRAFSAQRQPPETPGPTITKLPVNFSNRTFDPAAPPSDMPPLSGEENAECDSNFVSNASLGGQTRQIDATHATLTITQITVALQLNITIWTPVGATQRVIEHEEGHRQISEYYYRTADKLAGQIAARYIGTETDITGTDLNAESNKLLHQTATEIASEYNKELNPGPTQLLYDTITNHSRNDVATSDAVTHALKNVTIESN